MLLNDFFTIKHCVAGADELTALIMIRPDHPVFAGHFPGQPVVPGVCMIQIVKETLEQQWNKKLLLQESSQIKFLQLLVPDASDELRVHIQFKTTDSPYPITASISKSEVMIFKMNGIVN